MTTGRCDRSWLGPAAALVAFLLAVTTACSADDPSGGTQAEPGDAASRSGGLSSPPGPERPAAGDHRLVLALPDGTEGDYLLHAPEAVERKGRLPLVIAFHGNPGSPEEMARMTGLDAVADEHGFLVAYPSYYFLESADLGLLVDHLVETWHADPRRVHATGFSMGAAVTYRLAVELSDRIASFAPVSGYQQGELRADPPTSLLTFQGMRDDLADSFGPTNQAWAKSNRCAAPTTTSVSIQGGPATRTVARCAGGTEHVVYRVERMGHRWPREAGELAWDFFRAHPLRQR